MKKGLLLLFVLLSAIGLRAQDATVVGDTLKADTTTIVVGKTYIIGEQYVRRLVKFTAEKDGFLKIVATGSKISSGSIKVNGANANVVKDNATGSLTKGLAAGSVFTAQIYTNSNPATAGPFAFTVEFEEGMPYEPLTMTLANPAQGGEWSGAAQYKNYGTKGVPHFEFSSIISGDVVASVKVGDKVYSPIKCAVDGYYPNLDITAMPDTMSAAIAAGLLKAGDSFTLTLSGIVDKEFASNTIKDTTFTYTLASTACTGVNPAASTNRGNLPETVTFSFDGIINIDNAQFGFVDLFNSADTTWLEGATVEGTSVVIPIPAIEGLLPKKYDVVAKNVTDANGKVITYGTTPGQLVVSYGTSNGHFRPVVEPANLAELFGLKTITLTFPDEVVYDDSVASEEMKIQTMAGYDWATIDTITLTHAISEEDARVVTVTLSEEISASGSYMIEIPQKLFWSKKYYNAEDLNSAKYVYYNPAVRNAYDILPFGPVEVSPADGSTVNKLDEVVLTFPESVNVDEELIAVLVSGEMGVAPDTLATATLGWDAVDYTKLLVQFDEPFDSAGVFRLIIPAGAATDEATETKVNQELGYIFTVDPDYWDPEWVVEVSGTSQEEPVELVAGRKYQFSDLWTYMTFATEESGRLYFTPLDGRANVDLSICSESWMTNGDMPKNEEGVSWIGVEAGKTAYMTDYGISKRQYLVTFEAGSPYDALEYTGSFPAEGGQYSKSVEAPECYEDGAVEFYFSTKVCREDLKVFVVLPSKDNKKIEVTEDVQLKQGNIEYGEVPAYLGIVLTTVIDDIKNENGLKAGDPIQIVVENVHDLNFESNALAEAVSVNLTLAATVCTSINPDPNGYNGVDSIPAELSLRFDGEVACTNGKGWIIDVKSGNKQEFAIESLATEFVETPWSSYYEAVITLPEVTVELTSKLFAIQIEGLLDAGGNVVSYGDETGKFVINYSIRDDNFNPVSVVPENGSDVTSLKTIKLTFDDKVYLAPDAEAPYVYVGGNEVMGTLAVDPEDEKSVILTWDEEITGAGEYYPTIPVGAIYNSKFNAEKEDYGVADGAGYNPYLSYEYFIKADVSSTTVASITPSMEEGSLNNLPAEVVIEFDGNVKEVLGAYGTLSRYSTVEIPEDAIVLDAKLVDNKVVVTIPQEVIDAVSMGYFNITVLANGEDGKIIGSVDDPYAENISISYYIWKTLQLVESVPADGAVVKELSTITLTYDAPIFEIDPMYEEPALFDVEWNKVADLAYTFSGNQVTLTLAEPVTEEGTYLVYVPAGIIYDESYTSNNEHNLYITVGDAPAEDLAIVSATPENGATVANLTTVEFKLNKEVGYLEKSMLIPADGGDDAGYAALYQSETDPTTYTLDFTLLSEAGVALRKDVGYTITLDAYASEEASYRGATPETVTLTYVGAAEAYQYSDVTFEGITPAEDFVITDKTQNKFVVKFSGAVNMVEELTFVNLGQGATQAFESITANADKTEYTLTIAESVLETLRNEVYIIFAANDENGKRVQGNNGEEEFSCFAISFKTVIGVPDLTVTPDATAEQASLSVFSIKCAEGLTPSWTAGNITLKDANGNAIALNGDPEPVVAEGASEWATPTEWTIALAEKLEAVGTYTLTIPAGYFNIGNIQGQVLGNKETVVVFNITEEAKGIKGVTVDTEVVVYNVAGVVVANGKASEVLKSLNKGIYIVNGKKFVVK